MARAAAAYPKLQGAVWNASGLAKGIFCGTAQSPNLEVKFEGHASGAGPKPPSMPWPYLGSAGQARDLIV